MLEKSLDMETLMGGNGGNGGYGGNGMSEGKSELGTEKSVWKSIWNYAKLPRLCDWVISGLLIVGVIATFIIICL